MPRNSRHRVRNRERMDQEPDSAAAQPTVAELAERYMRLHVAVNCKPKTAQLYRGTIRTHILPALRESKTGPRMVALTSVVERVLDGVARFPDNPWVIVGRSPGQRRKTLKTTWLRVTKRAGIEDVRLHDLRHSYASRALALGENLTTIGNLLNHVRVQTTARYAHLVMDAEKSAALRIGDAISAKIAGQRARSASARPCPLTRTSPE